MTEEFIQMQRRIRKARREQPRVTFDEAVAQARRVRAAEEDGKKKRDQELYDRLVELQRRRPGMFL